MTEWFAAGLFAVVGLVLIVWRRSLAEMQAMLAGGTIRPGCAVAEGVVLLLMATAVVLWLK
jgi:hypothetical protein